MKIDNKYMTTYMTKFLSPRKTKIILVTPSKNQNRPKLKNMYQGFGYFGDSQKMRLLQKGAPFIHFSKTNQQSRLRIIRALFLGDFGLFKFGKV